MENRDILSTENTEKELSDKAKRDKLKWGIVLAFVLVAFILWLIFGFLSKPRKFAPENYSELIENTPKITENQVAFRINDVNISEDIWNYYFMREAEEYAENNSVLLKDVEWSKRDKKSQTVLEKVKYDAAVKLISDMVAFEKAAEWGITLTDEDREKTTDLDVRLEMFGEGGYEELGIKDEETYFKIRDILILKDKVREEVSLNLDKYTKDIDLTLFTTDKSATVRIIEVPIGEGSVHRANAKSKAEEIKERLLKGDDFDAVWTEVAKAYTARTDEMSAPMVAAIYKDSVADSHKDMEKAALSLKIGEISDIVKTDFSFMVIKRVKGYTEVINMLILESDISINKALIDGSKI